MSKKNSSLILLSQTIGICYAFCLAACFKDGRSICPILFQVCNCTISKYLFEKSFLSLCSHNYYYENISPVREFQFQCITVMLSVHSTTSPQQAYPAGHVPHTNVKRAHQEATLWSRRLFLSICATQLQYCLIKKNQLCIIRQAYYMALQDIF